MHVEPSGAIELVHERPWGSVRRVPLEGGVAWFKACAPVQSFEPRLTAALASRWPDRLPEVIAHDDERAWLLLGDAGEALGFDVGPEPWLSVLPGYAELQRGEAAQRHDGVPDRRLETFPALYESMLAHGLPGAGPLRAFASRFAELCAELAARDVPQTIQHDDLHGANVYGTRILDWGDACVAHPFLIAFVTFLHIDGLSDAWAERLRDAYLEPWGRPAELRDTFALAQRLGPFSHLFKELHVLDALPEDDRPRFAPDLPPIVELCVAATAS